MEPLDPAGVGVARSRPESSGVVRSRLKSSGVVRNRSRSESSGVARSRSESFGVGVVRSRPESSKVVRSRPESIGVRTTSDDAGRTYLAESIPNLSESDQSRLRIYANFTHHYYRVRILSHKVHLITHQTCAFHSI